jgi:hypothetical protein
MARRAELRNANPDLAETVAGWGQPASLALLKGTPINCLVVDWANGEPEDSAQQQALTPLVQAGRGLGIAFVGKITAKDGLLTAAEAGRRAGLSAVIVGAPPAEALALPAIVQSPRDRMAWEAAPQIFSSRDNVWPGLGLDTMHGDVAVAGPTGIPWANSNGWFSLLARELAPGKSLWLDFDPPDSSTPSHPASYGLAIADSAAYSSRWIISLDAKLRGALLKGDSQGLSSWSKICETLAFFNSHPQWERFQPQGILAVISDFHNQSVSGEVLNLLSRRQVQFRIVERSKCESVSMRELKAILWLDKEAPTAGQRSRLLDFTGRGGLLISAIYWGPAGIEPGKSDPSIRYNVYNMARGQIAVPEEPFSDPYQVAVDTHLLVSRRNDLVRLYNPAATNCHSSFDPGHHRSLVQVLNYSGKPADSVTLWVRDHISSARLLRPEAKSAVPIRGVLAHPGTDFHLPAVSVCCAIEFEGTNL